MAVLNIFFSFNVQNDNELKTSYHIDERFCRLRLHCSPHQQKYPSVKSPIWIFIRSYFLNLFSSLVFFTPSWCLTNLWQSFTGGNRVEDSQCTLLSVKKKRSYNSFTDKEPFSYREVRIRVWTDKSNMKIQEKASTLEIWWNYS